MNFLKPEPPFEPHVMGAGGNPNTVDLQMTYVFSEHPVNGGHPFILIECELTPEEVERVKRDGRLRIAIMGTRMPPILPFVETPAELGFYPADTSTGTLIDPRKVSGYQPG